MTAANPTPVFVLTGFLGSGKTTLLKSLLMHAGMSDTAVIINEFGEVGIDHFLVREVTEEVLLLGSGCVCCTVRDDLASTLQELRAMREAGTIPPFARVVIETTGLADPTPIVQMLIGNRDLSERYRMTGLTATIDSVFGWGQLDAHMEAVKQAAIADCLVLTKTDLADAPQLQALCSRLRQLNPGGRMIESAANGFPTPDQLFDPIGSFYRAASATMLLRRFDDEAGHGHPPRDTHGHESRHDRRISTFVVRIDKPVEWTLIGEWLELLLASRGESLLRIKGLVNVAGKQRPVVIQCVQHMVYPPTELENWPDADHSTRLVFITRDLTRMAVTNSLRQVLGGIAAGQS